ncbi:MAG: hypothetical protein JNM17_40745 [Archangium sp.]|nr:hypothetical protein [Archangium sp.]
MIALLVTMLLTADPATCSADADCVLKVGCECSCCPNISKSMTKAQADAVTKRCATLGECGSPKPCPDMVCPEEVQGAKAVCKAGACVKVSPPAPECKEDSDCTMAHDCTCECCPAPYEAMTKKKANELRMKCSRLGPCGRDPEMCAGVKCSTSNAGTATCREGKCARGGR